MGSIDRSPKFEVLNQFTPDYCSNRITQYVSTRTGMRIVVVDQEGPKLHGYFTLATEIHDDSGAPHTLEHLCFMGSRSYRYKGFLDKLATRAYSGTNAWTATDHTAYTLDTAGWAGFRQMLPVYLEHVILPTLTDAGCLTEVHHIDGNGLDAGVVYSEMQGVQNNMSELIDLKIKRLLYPKGSGFRYETGGMMDALRVLTADRIRQFHRDMYQPKNLCVIIFGELDHDELLETLEDFEDSILEDIPDPDKKFPRPWIDSEPVPKLDETITETVLFPEEDESMGQIDIRFLGPNCSDVINMAALHVVLLYLAGSPAAILDNTLVEKEQVASGVYFSVDSRPRTEIGFTLSGVEMEQLDKARVRFFEVLGSATKQSLDMNFLHDCLDRQVRTLKYAVESSATSFVDDVIGDYLFGKRDGSTLTELKTFAEYDTLKKWSEDNWRTFIQTYLSEAKNITILAKPSAQLSNDLKETEAQRVEEQIKRLGPDGLKKCEQKLEAAKAENDKEIPADMLARFRVPSTDSIHFITTSPARTGSALEVGRPNNKYQDLVDKDDKDLPLYIDFEHIPSNFVRLNVIIGIEDVPVELRPLISIYIEQFFNLPLKQDGKKIDFEDVVMKLERDTVGYEMNRGSGLGAYEAVRINIEVEVEKYQTGIKWLKELLWDSIFDLERIKATISRMLADIPDVKRDGNSMASAAYVMCFYDRKSLARSMCSLTRATYLKSIRSLLRSDPNRVVSMFETLRSCLLKFTNFRVLVIGDLTRISKPASTWHLILNALKYAPTNPIPALTPLPRPYQRLSPTGSKPGSSSSKSYIIPMPTVDSSYMFTIAQALTSHTSPELPALMVTLSYFNATEGPLWVAVRGTGLAYGTNLSYDLESGTIGLDIYRSPDAAKAFTASKDIIDAHINGSTAFDELMLEGAVSGIVVSFANSQATMATAAQSNFIRQMIRGLPDTYMHDMLRKVRDVTVEQIKECLKEHVVKAFDAEKSDVYCTCAPGLVEQISKGMKEQGYTLEQKELSAFQDGYGLGHDTEDDDRDEDEDGDEDDDDEGDEDDEEEDEDEDESEAGYEKA